MTWGDIAADMEGQMRRLAELDVTLGKSEQTRRRVVFVQAARTYEQVSADPGELWKYCFGKEVLATLATDLGFRSAEAMESRAIHLWTAQVVPRPALVANTRAYLDAIPVLG
jgi:hypothetical protein